MSETLTDPDEARHRLYELMKSDSPFQQKANEALAIGTQYLGADSGFISRVDPSTNYYEVIVSTESEGPLAPGSRKFLNETMCRHVLDQAASLAIHDLSAADDVDVPDRPLECYHGTKLTVDGEIYGTVCFVAGSAREPFSRSETLLAELIGRLIEYELEYDHQRNRLERQTSLVNILDRVVRHNIRNDMTVIHANARLHAEKHDGCEECAKIVRKSSQLIGVSETARYLGSLINSDYDRQPTDVVRVVEEVIAEARDVYPEASFRLESPDELVVPVLSSLGRALWELVDNAARHGGDSPHVEVTIAESPDSVQFHVADDGPGLPLSERDALQAGTETPLVHGSGLGLWTVYWVVTSHRGELDIDSEAGTVVTLTIPRGGMKSIETELEISQAPDMYRAGFLKSTVPMVLIDAEERIVDANHRAMAYLDSDRADILGYSLTDVQADLPGDSDQRFETIDRVDIADRSNGDQPLLDDMLLATTISGHELLVLHPK